MPRYYFHFRGRVDADDHLGEDFIDEPSACAYARKIAWELARNAMPADNRGARIVVVDGVGCEVCVVALEGSTDFGG
jgi:hypothetical protein